MNAIDSKTRDIRMYVNYMGKETTLHENDKFRLEQIIRVCGEIDIQTDVLKEVISILGIKK